MEITTIGHIISFIGAVFVVFAFYMMSARKYNNDSMGYYISNLIGGVLLLISLFINFNLGSFLIEIFWIVISLKGIIKSMLDNKKLR